jgi:poly(A) polymerase
MLMRPTFPLELELHRLDCVGSHGMLDVHEFLNNEARELAKQPEIVPPLLTGNDLMEMGLAPGPGMGEWLKEIRERQLQDELRTADEARKWLREKLGESPAETKAEDQD